MKIVDENLIFIFECDECKAKFEKVFNVVFSNYPKMCSNTKCLNTFNFTYRGFIDKK